VRVWIERRKVKRAVSSTVGLYPTCSSGELVNGSVKRPGTVVIDLEFGSVSSWVERDMRNYQAKAIWIVGGRAAIPP
jgi:hypothetical protein